MRTHTGPYRYRNTAALLVLALLAIFVHTRWLGRMPLTEDEETSADVATGMGFRYETPQYAHVVLPPAKKIFTPADLWQRNNVRSVTTYTIADNGNNYAYNLLLHYWIELAGFSVFRIRLLSAVCIIFTTLLLFRLGQKINGSFMAGLFAAALFALHPVVIIYGHIARSYALSMLLVTLSMGLVCLLVKSDLPVRRRRWLYMVFVIVSVSMVMSHYFNAVIVCYNLAALFITARRRHTVLPVVITAIGVLLPVMAWLLVSGTGFGLVQNFQAHVDAQAGQLAWLPEAKPLPTAMGLLAMLASAFGNATLPGMGLKMWINIALLLLPAVLIVYALKRSGTSRRSLAWYMTGAVGSFVLFALLVAVVSGHLFICQFRFWVFIIPYAVLLPAFALQKEIWAGKSAFLPKAAVLLIMLRAVFTGVTFVSDRTVAFSGGHITIDASGPGYHGEPYETAATAVKEKYRQGYTVLYNNPRVAQNINWFLRGHPQIQQSIDTQVMHRITVLRADGTPVWTFDDLDVHENIDGAN